MYKCGVGAREEGAVSGWRGGGRRGRRERGLHIHLPRRDRGHPATRAGHAANHRSQRRESGNATYIHTYIHTYSTLYTHAYIHIHIYTYVQTFIHTYIQPYKYKHTYVVLHPPYVYMEVYMYVWL